MRLLSGRSLEGLCLVSLLLALPAGAQTRRGAEPPPPRADARGRVIFFFVDDVHLAPDSFPRARASLLRFIDEQLAERDRAAVVTPSGRLGFLQQLTDNKAVLREAVGRLACARRTCAGF